MNKRFSFYVSLIALGLMQSSCGVNNKIRMHLSPAKTAGDQKREFHMDLGGSAKHFQLSPDTALLASDARVIFQNGDHIEEQPLSYKVFSTKSDKESAIVIADEDGTVRRALIQDESGAYEVRLDALTGQTLIEYDSELPAPEGHCGVDDSMNPPSTGLPLIDDIIPVPTQGPFPTKWASCSQADTAPLRQNIGVAMDIGEFKKLGSSRTAAQDEIIRLVLRANGAYLNQMNVVLALQTIYIMEGAGGPTWNQEPTTMRTKTCPKDINADLDAFTAWYAGNVYNKPNMAQGQWVLLTACYPPSGTVGLAWIGTLCNARYATSVVDGWSRPDVTFAHELGHNFGGQHAFGHGGIMDYSDGTINGIFQFAPVNQPQICSALKSSIPGGLSRKCFEPYTTEDKVPPTTPTGLMTSLGVTGIDLSWNASTDNVRVAGYHIYRDAVKIASTPGPNFTDTNVAPESTYTYYLYAYDAAGNVSGASTASQITTPVVCFPQ